MVNYSQQKGARIQEYSRANANVNYIRGRTRRKGCRSNNFILLRKRSQQNENIITIYRLRSLAKCGSCGASPSVRLKPTAVRVMANPTASETGGGGGPQSGTARTAEPGSYASSCQLYSRNCKTFP